ncbi:MAG: galactofuranose transport system substrate-binding protein [Acidobacteriota bacterium]|nr:galactofuranose transport system substrate-binding protein [Acidobacteriota bacterium]
MKSTVGGRKSLAVLVALLFACALALGGCRKESSSGGSGGGGGVAGGGGQNNAGGKKVIGFSQMEMDGPWRIAETESIKGEAAKKPDKYDLRVTVAQGDTAKQAANVEDLVAQRVDAIFLAPRETVGFEQALATAKSANIPVILVDREASGTAGDDFVTVLKSDFVKQGQRAAEWLATASNGKANIVELSGTSGASVTADRGKGFRDEIAKHPEMKIIQSQTGDFNRAKARDVMQNIIQARGKEITAVYAHNDEMALGAIQALEAAGMKPGTDVLIISVDGQKSALQAILDGKMNVTIESNPRFGPLAFATLEKFWAGEKLPPIVGIEDRLFDKTNAAQFLNEAY